MKIEYARSGKKEKVKQKLYNKSFFIDKIISATKNLQKTTYSW